VTAPLFACSGIPTRQVTAVRTPHTDQKAGRTPHPALLYRCLVAEGGPVAKDQQPQRAPGRWRLAWQVLTNLPPEDKRAEIRSSTRERHLRRLRFRRKWRRRLQWIDPGKLRWIDPGKPPLTVVRWLAVLGIALAWWANGAPTSPLGRWLPYAIIVGVLILPDLAGLAIGGLRIDMREAQDDISRLRQDVNAQARATASASASINLVREAGPGLRVIGDVTGAEGEPLVPYVPRDSDTDDTTKAG